MMATGSLTVRRDSDYTMALDLEVLGGATTDNAIFVTLNTGQRLVRILLDCGEGCLRSLPQAEVRDTDMVLFSHFHMDHVGDFEYLFRRTYSREDRPLRVWGPAGSIQVMHHRVHGYEWNLLDASAPGMLVVTEVTPDSLYTASYRTSECFEPHAPAEAGPFTGTIWDDDDLRIECRIMDHKIPCLAYAVTEKDQHVIDPDRLAALGLEGGPWCAQVKSPTEPDEVNVSIDDRTFTLGTLRQELVRPKPGRKIGYLTDFLLNAAAERTLLDLLSGSEVLVAECSYRNAEIGLAQQYHHFTTRQIGELAAKAGARELVLCHISGRYPDHERAELLREVAEVFPGARFPAHW